MVRQIHFVLKLALSDITFEFNQNDKENSVLKRLWNFSKTEGLIPYYCLNQMD